MRDPAREEQSWRCLCQIQWIEEGIGEKISRVIEGHQNHHETAQQIDRGEASG